MSEPGLVDLGGCEGCGLGCAVACASGGTDTALSARRVLVATGAALALLAGVPALVVAGPWTTALGVLTTAVGLVTAVLGAGALWRGRPGGDPSARAAYRLVPVGVAGMVATWGAVALGALTG